MAVFGGVLILLGIGAVVLGFASGASFGIAELGSGFGLLVLGCVLVGLDRMYQAIRASSAEIKALQQGFELLPKQLESQSEPARATPSIPSSPRMPPNWRPEVGS